MTVKKVETITNKEMMDRIGRGEIAAEQDTNVFVTGDKELHKREAKVSAADASIIHSTQTGEGMVELTPEMLKEMFEAMEQRKKHIDEEYPKLIAACDDETRLAITAQVMKAICDHAKEGGSFRYLIYDRLGFGPHAYMPLYLAGGMEISNGLALSKVDDEEQGVAQDIAARYEVKPAHDDDTKPDDTDDSNKSGM